MSPLSEHERLKKFIARLLEMLTFVLDINMSSGGSTTFRRKEKLKGLEPDECYFFKNATKMRGVKRWNPAKHPPPDLAVEVDIMSRSIDREPIYAALGVPELWRWDGAKLQCLHLTGDHLRHPREKPFPAVSKTVRPDEIHLASAGGARTRCCESLSNGCASRVGRNNPPNYSHYWLLKEQKKPAAWSIARPRRCASIQLVLRRHFFFATVPDSSAPPAPPPTSRPALGTASN